MSLRSGFAALTSLFPLKSGAETFLPNLDERRYHAFQKGRDASPVLFQQSASPFQRGLNPQFLQGPLADQAIGSPSGGRVSAPKLLFYMLKSSTHWSNKHKKKSGHGCVWRSGTYLPAFGQVCGASLLAAIWKVSRKKLPPLALGNTILPADTFSLGGRRLPVFLTPLITSPLFPFMLQWMSVGKSHGLPHMLSPAISLQGEQLSAAAPRV